jgi:hypothetical protein
MASWEEESFKGATEHDDNEDAGPNVPGVTERDDDSEDHEDVEAELQNEDLEDQKMILSTMVARQIMLMRIHKDDPRSNGDIAHDVLQLVQLRSNFVRKHNLSWWKPLSYEQFQIIWNEDLWQLFLEELPEQDESVHPAIKKRSTKRQLHSIFRVWMRKRFGHVAGLRDTLKHPCSWESYDELKYRQNVMIVHV